ncbi:MAG: hypothetical protein EGQ16_04885 [Clostridiales bacterium]|nr:hypothetical protein [Clostridiales bacterium]
MKNYYELLEVNPKASKEIIEKAYKVLIKQCHPDGYIGEEKVFAEEKTRELNEAYHILSDDFLRSQYDLELQKQENNQKSNRFQNNINTRQNYNNKQEGQQYQEPQQEIKQHKVGSFMAMVDVFNAVFKKRKNGPKIPKQLKREDWLAGVITIAIVLILGIILWFIPATNGFIRSLNPFS